MSLRLAARPFALQTFPKITTLMATFFGHPVHPICRHVIYFYEAIWKAECFRRSGDLHTLELRISEERNAISAVMSVKWKLS